MLFVGIYVILYIQLMHGLWIMQSLQQLLLHKSFITQPFWAIILDSYFMHQNLYINVQQLTISFDATNQVIG